MDSAFKNITILLFVATFALFGYYFYTQQDMNALMLAEGESEALFNDVQKFAERRQQLDGVKMSTELFSDPYFRSLVSYGTPVPEQPFGRQNPFDRAEPTTPGNF